MAVPFLSVYQTLEKFVAKFPAFKGLASAENLDIVYMVPTLEERLKLLGLDPKADALKAALATLSQTHDRPDLMQGILTLVGVGKGDNRQLMHRGSYVAKFNPDNRSQASWMADRATLAKMDRCVKLAQDLAKLAAERTQGRLDPESAKIASHHLGVGPHDDLWTNVAHVFKRVDEGLRGVFRLAANRPDGKRTAIGYVSFKEIADLDEPSASKTPGAPVGARGKGATHGGSIHMDYQVFSPQSPWTDLGVAAVIVHEASHKFGLTDDHAYHHEGDKYDKLTPVLRVDNADSYAFVAASLWAGRLLTTRPTSELKA